MDLVIEWIDRLTDFSTFYTIESIKKLYYFHLNILKDKNFPKIWTMWLKKGASYIHFNFELLKGVAVLIFSPHP